MDNPGSGVVIFDTNTFRHLTDATTRQNLLDAIRNSGRVPIITEINLLEVAPTTGSIGAELRGVVEAVESVAGGTMPWTYRVMKQAGEEFLQGRLNFSVPLISLDISTDLPDFGTDSAKALAFAKELNAESLRVQQVARPRVQRTLRDMDARSRWPTLPDFLRDFWEPQELGEQFADQAWANLQLPGPRPKDLLTRSLTFRMLSDIDAVETYQGAIAFQQPRRVQRMDLLQLPYLTCRPNSILVTDDGPFATAAHEVIDGRYPGLKVISTTDLHVFSA